MSETTTVTVMFTDVVGSTSMRQNRGETAAHEIMGAHNEIVRRQIAEYTGQEVKTIGDSFMVAFDSARKAVECAIAVQRSLHAYSRAHPSQPVKVRIGLHTGEAIREGHDLFGTSVDAAARIMAKAAGDQILVSETLKSVLGAAKDVEFRDGKRVRLKGFPERWHLWEVAWRSPAEAEAAERPASPSGRTPYVGRVEERATLRRLIDRAAAGAGAVALIAGEAGLGKTRLVEEMIVEARARGMFVVRGQCHDMDGAPPYAPFVEAIEYGLAVSPREVFRAAMGEAGPEIARFVPKVRAAFPDLPPPIALPSDQARHYMFESVCDFLQNAGAGQPLVVVLEDLHWADESTTQLLESVGRRVERAAMLVIGTYRDVDLGPRDPFVRGIEHLSRLAAVSRIALKRLTIDEAGDVLRALAGREPPGPLVQVVFEETEGVPFFIEELYRHLAEERRLTDESGNWLPRVAVGEIEVPETIRLVLGRRIDRISETAQRVMTTASCIGRSFTYDFLVAVADGSDDEVLDALDEAESARLVTVAEGRNPHYVFSHEQIRQTLLSRLSFVRRQRLHRRVADAIERVHAGHLDDHVTDLAYHLAQAGAGERAATYLHRAGVASAARLATPEALAFFAKAAELAGPGPTRRGALRARGELLLGLFRGLEATVDLELAVQEAAEDGELGEEMEALLRLGRAYYVVGLDHGPAIAQSRAALERARALAVRLGDLRGEARALIPSHRYVDFDRAYREEAVANNARALAIARELGDEELEIDALRGTSRLTNVAFHSENIGRISVALERRGDLVALNEHLFDSMWAYWSLARFEDAVACSDRATALAARLGIPPVQYGTIKALALMDLGRLADAWAALETEVVDDEHPFGQVFQRFGRVEWHMACGDVERVIREVPSVVADARALKRSWMVPWAQRLLALAVVRALGEGTDEATLRAAVEDAGGSLRGDALAEAMLLVGRADAALDECERALPRLREEGRVRDRWVTEEVRARALLAQGRPQDAVAVVDEGLALLESSDWRSMRWRLGASRAVAWAALADDRAHGERRRAADALTAVAGTLRDTTARARFLSQPGAAALSA